MIKINCPTCLRPTYAIYENAGILNYIEDLFAYKSQISILIT